MPRFQRLPDLSSRPTFSIRINGRSTPAGQGETIAAVMLAAGLFPQRPPTHPLSSQAGFYCGMGICFGCVVLVDDRPARACQAIAAPGMQIQTNVGADDDAV